MSGRPNRRPHRTDAPTVGVPRRLAVVLVAVAAVSMTFPATTATPDSFGASPSAAPPIANADDGFRSPQPLIEPIPRGTMENETVVDGDSSQTSWPPTLALTIRPGRQLHIDIPDDGDPEFRCTMNFVYEEVGADGTGTGDLYVGTAGHCVLPDGMQDSQDNDFKQPDIQVCASLCVPGTSRWLSIDDGESDGDGVLYARQHAPGDPGKQFGHDYAFIDVPDKWEPHVEPRMPLWRGPVSELDDVRVGRQLGMYGQGIGFGDAEADPRPGVSIFGDGDWYQAVMPVIGGDSGSPVVRYTDIGPDVATSRAVGAVTHGVAIGVGNLPGVPVPSLAWGTLSEQATSFTENTEGTELDLVLSDGSLADNN